MIKTLHNDSSGQPLTPQQALNALFEPQPLKKKDLVGFSEITQKNYPAIIRQMSRLVYRWLWKHKVPVRYVRRHCEQFWQHVWIKRHGFDRSKGRLSTWLGFKFLSYMTYEERLKSGNTQPLTRSLSLRCHFQGTGQTRATTCMVIMTSIPHLTGLMLRADGARLSALPTGEQILLFDEALHAFDGKDFSTVELRLIGHEHLEIALAIDEKFDRVNTILSRLRRNWGKCSKERKGRRADRSHWLMNAYWREYFKTELVFAHIRKQLYPDEQTMYSSSRLNARSVAWGRAACVRS